MEFDSVPEVVTRNTTARVRYQCPRACRVRLEVVLTTPHEIEQLVFRRTWTSVKNPGTPRVRMVPLNFPPAIIYKQDFSRRHSIDAREVMIRALLTDIDTHVTETHPRAGEYLGSLAHTFKLLRTVPPAERPVQPHTMCTSWGAELMWQLTKGRIHQCPFESGAIPVYRLRALHNTSYYIRLLRYFRCFSQSVLIHCPFVLFFLHPMISDVVDVMQFPLVSTGERYGVIRTFQPFVNRELETARYHNMEHPRSV